MFRQVVELMHANPLSFGALVLAVGIGGTSFVSDGTNPQWEKQNSYLLATGVAIFVSGLALHFYEQHKKADNDNVPSGSTMHTPKPTTATTSNKGTKLKSIWETCRNGETTGNKGKAYSDKPFGSKYYYAHNNPNATGGYKDGLKMEDYQMNGPRLLSKGGLPVVETTLDEDSGGEDVTSSNVAEDGPIAPFSVSKPRDADNDVIIISKYLWDDPGDSNGVATIRIEVLPDPKSKMIGQFVDCKDVSIVDVDAALAGEGLLVKFATNPKNTPNIDCNTGEKQHRYQLKISKMYGDAADVKVVVKPKRLLVKIHKKKNSVLSSIGMNGGSNLDAWPTPHRKI